MKISHVIKKHREENHLTQVDLAKQLNVSRSTISSWENGRSYPDLEMVLVLSHEFDVSVDKLLKEDGEIVQDISKDTRTKKRKVIINIILSVVVVCLLIVIFNLKFRVQRVDDSRIESVQVIDNQVTIALKKSIFYKNIAYTIDTDDENTVNISIESFLLLVKLVM